MAQLRGRRKAARGAAKRLRSPDCGFMTPWVHRALLALILLLGPAGCKTDAACQDDCLCKQKGHCGARFGKCQPTEDSHCQNAEVCRLFGTCAAEGGRCVAKSDEHCKASDICAKTGACTVKEGRCK